ncbi:MAG: DUF4214 domain-containing protein [Lachnospiraceae bacterium]|nr:DUF4214 domain-containing protein [Lachnospiraceae bacterium]
MRKTVFNALASLVLVLCCIPVLGIKAKAVSPDTTWQDNYNYELREGSIYLKSYKETAPGGDIVIPATATVGGVTYGTVIESEGRYYETEDDWGYVFFFPVDNIASVTTEDGVKATCLNYLFYNSIQFNGYYNEVVPNATLESLHLESLDTSDLTAMQSAFAHCANLTSLDLSRWDTGNVVDMNATFHGCKALSDLKISEWDTSNCESMGLMFDGCRSLERIDLSHWDITKVTNMNAMFGDCARLVELNLRNFQTDVVRDVSLMFWACYELEKVNLSGFDLSNVQYFEDMFEACNSLKEIRTPMNTPVSITLPKTFYDGNGNSYTELPMNNPSSMRLTDQSNPEPDNEAVNDFVSRLYHVFLDREPEQEEVEGWASLIVSGQKTAGEAAAGFIFSPEFTNRNMCNSHFLDYLYLGLFDRAADDTGKEGWTLLIDEGYSREKVVQGFLTSPEFIDLCAKFGVNCGTGLANVPELGTIQTDHCTIAGCPNDAPVKIMVVSLYDTVFGRVPSQDEVDFWVNHMANHTPGVTARVMVNTFLNGEEYSNLNRNNTEYITDLYHAIFNRDADEGGLSDWLNRLENLGWTREQVLNGFTASAEFIDQCHHAGIEIGGEIETQ